MSNTISETCGGQTIRIQSGQSFVFRNKFGNAQNIKLYFIVYLGSFYSLSSSKSIYCASILNIWNFQSSFHNGDIERNRLCAVTNEVTANQKTCRYSKSHWNLPRSPDRVFVQRSWPTWSFSPLRFSNMYRGLKVTTVVTLWRPRPCRTSNPMWNTSSGL